jgi:hypothetical protein
MQSISIITEKVIAQKTGHIMNAGMMVKIMILKWPSLTDAAPVVNISPKLNIETYFLKTRLKNTSDNYP